jgi:hypothetical protein
LRQVLISGGALVSSAPTKKKTLISVSLDRLVHLRQVHPLKAPLKPP